MIEREMIWRRERDSNPRCRYKRHTRFPVVLLQPLGHLSACKRNKRVNHKESPTRGAGGEGGIRTHDPGLSQDTAFRERGLQPLGNLSLPLTQGVSLTLLKRPVNGYPGDRYPVRPLQKQFVFHLMAATEFSIRCRQQNLSFLPDENDKHTPIPNFDRNAQ